MRRNHIGVFSRNAASKVAGLRRIRETVAAIVPGSSDLKLTEHQGGLWVFHKPSSILLHKAEKVDRKISETWDLKP